MSNCNLCPRKCNSDRNTTPGLCGTENKIKVARAALHFWEEPCISFENGSGAVFFSGCPLHCIYCQNKKISDGVHGLEISADRLYCIFTELLKKGAENINLVTAGHFLPEILPVLKRFKNEFFQTPIIYNTSAYETTAAIRSLNNIADIYLPDLKYISEETAALYSSAPDYFRYASAAIDEMVSQKSECIFDNNGKMLSGVIVRHLVLPGHTEESKQILSYLHSRYGDKIMMSIMSQYTPVNTCKYRNLNRRLTAEEYDDVIDFAVNIGIENAFIQEGESAEESFIPDFNFEGVL